jgi:hypothetical protein
MRAYKVYTDPTVRSYKEGGMCVNQMNGMVFGSPTPFSLPIGCLRLGYKHGGIIPDVVNHAQSFAIEALKLKDGGYIEANRGRPPKEILVKMNTQGVDNIPCLLQGGELVINKKNVPLVTKFLKEKNIHLPNM